MPTSPDLAPGDIVWAELDPAMGREQGGRRPVVVVASSGFLDVVDSLAIVVPVTSVDRGWPNHVRLGRIQRPSFAMTEQVRAVARRRLHGRLGHAAPQELADIRMWLSDFLGVGH
ncbi:type II toxin-antitoxin system PemK/MazF family toxin [Ornithinimicrobium sp. F0845]|uniref:type II toxin-antitoxin system PemK/MazF family toxin n=1 Tax=Ornithinimicrobium sp. F0845 TaxID=2926412 RepID=UPI001FF5B336|nr:type II toxin-antitoxin system PemK/MazF family toxin [Ornithinimicrobium sp. F0845]MCK0112468.1 type II toxin-antitoxin system PemK/MazF family toxin [Ornithinimicrobium sp. F0845]